MARSSQSLRARVTQATRRRRKKPANPIQRAFDDLKNLVTEAAGRPANRQTAAKKAAGERQRTGRRRQEAAKQTAARRRSKSR
jgi:hypothetical protein